MLYKERDIETVTSSVVSQKGESQNGCFKKTKHVNFYFRKTNISYLVIRTYKCAYQEVRYVRFSENLACFLFLEHPFWDSHFCLITDDLNNLTIVHIILEIKSSIRKCNVLGMKHGTPRSESKPTTFFKNSAETSQKMFPRNT